MRLVTVILIASLMQVSAASLAQKITLNKSNAPLRNVLKDLRTQSGYTFLFSDNDLKASKPVTINVKNVEFDQVLKLVFSDQPLVYSVNEKAITIAPKATSSFFEKLIDRFQTIDIKGKVVDSEGGQALVGATVKVKGSDKSTTTDSNGDFFLQGVDERATIVISYIGYKVVERTVERQMGTIKLEMSTSDLQEVVVNKGYYTTTSILNTGSVSSVKAAEIDKQPVLNPLLALQGRMPGVLITETNGNPGAQVNIQIRGRNSIGLANVNSDVQPLILIDGVPYPATNISGEIGMANRGQNTMSSINPKDIESVDVLKDADATAIYGSRGANGVVLITTKKAKAGETRVSFNAQQGWGKVTKFLDLMDTKEYVAMRKEAFRNDNVTPTVANAYDLLLWDTTRYVNWQKMLMGETAHFTNANASLSGGGNNTSFLLSTNYSRQSSVSPGDFADTRGGIHFAGNLLSTNQKFKATFSSQYTNDVNTMAGGNTIYAASVINLPPNAPYPFDDAGNLVWSDKGVAFSNPFRYLKTRNVSKTDNMNLTLNLGYQLLSNLALKGRFGYTYIGMDQVTTNPIAAQVPGTNVTGTADFGDSRYKNWIIEPQIEYTTDLYKGKFSALLGTTFQKDVNVRRLIEGTGFTNDQLISSPAYAANSKTSSDEIDYRYQAVFGRLSYSLSDRYVLNLTGRRDGSSRFGPGRQFGNFGAAGAAWIFSEEPFLQKRPSWFSFGKVRGSYGVTGSDAIRDYSYFDLFQNNFNGPGLTANSLKNDDLAWEENRKFEIGVELGFLKDRIYIAASSFRNVSGNQLVSYTLPTQTGFSFVVANLPAEVENKGYELLISSKNVNSGVFTWNTDFNITWHRNKLLSFPDLATSSYANTLVIGKSVDILKRLELLGVDEQTGIYNFNGTSAPADQKILIDPTPRFYGGLNNTFSWKGISLSFFMQFAKQTGANYISYTGGNSAPGTLSNQDRIVLGRWQKPGDMTDIQRFTTTGAARSAYLMLNNNSDAKYTDASYIRLKNINISYALPKRLIQRLKMSELKLYASGQNLLTITNYKGNDPETGSRGANTLGPLKMFTAGFQLGL